ncbi:alcohol oxidase-like protein [Irpex rosettiformis]|uniref:Alcohol oxidase-like protein n=1 Tax=Irpex rosettiformis TaxID=378272 RepID=A0ACB8U6I5_9APHY|nr:alcohol oxidase-like protein [Irpex rosettiformis]
MSAQPEFDVIFAGGGTSACLIAGRLADADPNLKILIVEAGPHTENDLAHTQPARYLNHISPTTTTATFMVANPEVELAGRQTIVPVGSCLGGSSSMNFMMYTRAVASDFDEWEEQYKNPGWGSKDIIPLLKKTENYQVAPGKDSVHGYNGRLKVSYAGVFTNIGKDFLAVGEKYDPSRGISDDPNDLFNVNVHGRWQKWISEDGKRSDVVHHFIYDKKRDNITIVVGHLIKRVIFEGKRAVGVEYVQNPRFHPTASSSEVTTARAKRLVVVSAGAFGSPTILERSGIGAKKVLEKYGIEQVVDLPGVGENYQDHQVIFAPYLASEESDTIDAIVRNEQPAFDNHSDEWKKTGKGLMASNALDAGVKLRFTDEELKTIGPEFTKKWHSYYASRNDSPAMWIGTVSMFVGDPSTTPSRKYFSIGYYVQHPSSLGFVHIRSGTDPTVPPEFETGYLKQKDDLELLKFGYKRAREYARRMPAYRGEYVPNHPKFASDSASAKGEIQPVAIDAPDIAYTEEDEKAIEEYTRKAVGTAWHSLGTCAMKPREEGGVVDSKLNVYGVENLKVADLSIPPSNVAANTYSTTLGVAEKAAVIIAAELGITGV